MVSSDFENRLVEALQPIRYLALAQALYQLMDTGLYGSLAEGGSDVDVLARHHGFDPVRLLALLRYLANEGYAVDDDGWRLTVKGRALLPFRPWYTLLVGGYAGTFGQIGSTLAADAPWATRDGSKVGTGSCGISRYDALPIVGRLLDQVPGDEATVVDIGCGDAAFLIELCQQRPGIVGIGLDPDAASVHIAKERIKRADIGDRVSVHQTEGLDTLHLDLPADGQICFLASFALQEILEQDGEDAIRGLLRRSAERYPNSCWLVVEVDHQPTSPKVMAHGLGLAYYNPYYLLHALTEQRLETREFWDSLFDSAGMEVVAFEHPSASVDSTDLELGYLLRPSSLIQQVQQARRN